MVRTKQLMKKYGRGSTELVALRPLDLEIKNGEFVAIIGPSGAGKSTLLYQLSLLDEPTAGEVYFNDVLASALSQKEKTETRLTTLGYVFQDFALIPELTALENVALPMFMQGLSRADVLSRAERALTRIGVGNRKNNLPSELSGGEQQRVSIARAIAHNPRILFADEPTANLDSMNAALVLEAFLDLHRNENQTIVMVTHEEEYARRARRVISMKDGAVISDERRS